MAAFVVGEPSEDAGLDRAAPATLGHCGGVAGAEAEPAHGGPIGQVQRMAQFTPAEGASGSVIERSPDNRIAPRVADFGALDGSADTLVPLARQTVRGYRWSAVEVQ
jgi:hypothetical protein